VSSGAKALEVAQRSEPIHLILLDMKLPDLPGTEVYRRLRSLELTRDTPIVFVTAAGHELERIVALELGADDCVSKPYRMYETTLRARALLRRFAPAPLPVAPARHTADGLLVDVDAHQAFLDGVELALTALEFRLLQVLMSRRGRVQSRAQLLQDVWSMSSDVTTRTVDTHIKRLREKLGPAAAHVETIRGVGYRFERKASGPAFSTAN
jgi:two-component system phosphate regulon response regulator PhoB